MDRFHVIRHPLGGSDIFDESGKQVGYSLPSVLGGGEDFYDMDGNPVGQSFDDVKKVFGEPTSVEDFGITYVKNGIKLQFLSDGSGKVITISLTHETPEA